MHTMGMEKVLFGVYVIVLFPSVAFGANVICASVQMPSHVGEMQGATERLSEYGHTVYFAVSSQYPNSKMESFKKRGIRPLVYNEPDNMLTFASEQWNTIIFDNVFGGKSPREIDNIVSDIIQRDCSFMLNDTVFLNNARALNASIVIGDALPFLPCNLLLARRLGIPLISVTTSLSAAMIRMVGPPSVEPTVLTDFSDKMSFSQRLLNTFVHIMFVNFIPISGFWDTSLLRQYAPEYRNWNDLQRDALLFIMTRDFVLGYPTVSTPNVIRLPGVSCSPAQHITGQFENIMTSVKDGVIVVSLGSMGAVIPRPILEKFLTTFAKLKNTIIMRNIPPNDIEIPSNVHVFSWLPQNDLLGDDKTVLFITHCGNGGQYEAVYHGVPMVGFPLFAEQHHNSFRMEDKGIGIRLDILQFTSDELLDTINEVLNNHIYRDNVNKLSQILRNMPMEAQNISAFWIDHVIKYGGEHLRSHALDMPWYEFYMIDVLLLVGGFVTILLSLTYYIVRCITHALCKRKTKLE